MQTKAGAKKAALTKRRNKLAQQKVDREAYEASRAAIHGTSQPPISSDLEPIYVPEAEQQRNNTPFPAAISSVLEKHRRVVSAQTLAWSVEQVAKAANIGDEIVTVSRRDFDALIALAYAARETNK